MDESREIPGPDLHLGLASPVPPPRERLPREFHLSTAVTLLMALVLMSGIGFVVWLQISIPRLDRVGFPERALPNMVGRTLDAEEAIARAPFWERALYHLTTDNGSNDLSEIIAWYRELAAVTYDPRIHLQLAILEGEAGRLDDLRRLLSDWADREVPFPLFSKIVRAAYLEGETEATSIRPLQAELADAVPAGWFYEKAAMRLAERSADRKFFTSIQEESAARVAPLLQKVRVMTAVELVLILLGLLSLRVLLRHRGQPYRVGCAAIPPRWRGRAGIAVLIRGGAMGVLVSLAFLFLEADSVLIRLISIPLAGLPLLVLTRQYLLEPYGDGFITSLGLLPVPEGHGRLIIAVGAVTATGLMGEWGLGLIGEWWGVYSHWTEWFDADLVWGDMPVVVVSLLEFTVLAPILEELAFRGLLFGTLRRQFTWGTSAVLSGAMFAVAHGYGLLGFLSVFWSGLLWAWIYEKTGSLLPSMLAHAANNLFVCLSILYLFRL